MLFYFSNQAKAITTLDRLMLNQALFFPPSSSISFSCEKYKQKSPPKKIPLPTFVLSSKLPMHPTAHMHACFFAVYTVYNHHEAHAACNVIIKGPTISMECNATYPQQVLALAYAQNLTQIQSDVSCNCTLQFRNYPNKPEIPLLCICTIRPAMCCGLSICK